MFGNFQKRVQTWFGKLKIDAGKLGGNQAGSAMEIIQDWNTIGTPTLIKATVATGNAASNSKLLELFVGSGKRFSVDASGKVSIWNNFNQNLDLFLANGVLMSVAGSYIGGGHFYGAANSYARIGKYGPYEIGVGDDGNGRAESGLSLYGKYASDTSYQRAKTSVKIQALTAATGATVKSTIVIPKYSYLIGVTTRVTTAIGTSNGTTGYQVGDGADSDLWGAITGTAIGTTSDATNFTATTALGPADADRTITLTATSGNFDGTGVIEVCAFYLRAEAD